jgi:DNA primase
MIGGSKRIELTPETIFQRITSYDIFRFYMPQKDWRLNHVTNSPFRRDETPSFIIGNRGGDLTFIDFGDTSKKGDCFTFLKLLYGLDMNGVLTMIDKDFGLGLSGIHTNTQEYKIIKSDYKQPEELGKRYALIQVLTKPFTKEELAYWNQFHISLDELRANNVYSLKKVYLNRELFRFKDELKFGYFYDGNWKIYRPLSDKKQKWIPNNVPIDTMEGKENLSPEKDAFINKSKKDYMVVRKLLGSTCAVQNEGIGCFTEENVTFLRENSKRQILSFDSDITGVENSQQITKIFDFDYANVPRIYLNEGIKDWAELARCKGMSTVETIFKEKGLI